MATLRRVAMAKFLVLYRSPTSVQESGSRVELDGLLAEHPHRHTPDASIDASELLAMPGR